MATSEASDDRIVPREVTVRPVRDAHERRRWDALASEFHYLPFHGLFGQSLRHVAVRGETWVALVGWTAGAFKVAARDAWIGWSRERQFRRLKLIANNSRFVVLGGKGVTRNLASRVLGLSLRRLSRGHARGARFPGSAGRDVRRSVALRGHLLPSIELADAGTHARLHAPAGQPGAVARERTTEGGLRVCAGGRCARGAEWHRGTGRVAHRREGGTDAGAAIAQSVRLSGGDSRFPQGARAALQHRLLSDDRDRGAAGWLPRA